MKEEIMKALILLAQSTIDKARKKGFDIMLLLGGITVMGWQVIQLDTRLEAKEIKWESKLDRVNSEWSAALNATNIRLQDCERDKYDLSIRVAVLEFSQMKKKVKR